MLLESQVQFVMSHAHADSSSELLAQDYPFVRVGSDMLIPVSAPDSTRRPRHRLARATAKLALAGAELQPGVRHRPHPARGARRGARTLSARRASSQAHLASVLRTMALDGRGMAWLPRTLIQEDLDTGRLVEAAPRDWCVEMEVRLYRDRVPMGKAAEDFWAAACADVTANPDGKR